MPLKKNMDADKIVDYLNNDLKVSVINDVKPCLNIGRDEGGYFAVPRLVLSYVDYLGALYNGYTGKRDKRDKKPSKRIFATSKYAKTFLKEIFGLVDSNYSRYGDLVWDIYRNGTIHLYAPFIFENKKFNKTIGWLTYKGARIDQLDLPNSFQVTHLVPYDRDNNKWWQPISITCLYEDLIFAIDKYAFLVSNYSDLVSRFQQTADALLNPQETTLTWW
jgi:hypothetical protein